MKPYMICHMMASLDGRIDCDMTEKIENGDEYYEALDQLEAPTRLSGRITALMHYAQEKLFVANNPATIGTTAFHKACDAAGYAVVADSQGTLCYPGDTIDGKPIVCLVSRAATREYVTMLQNRGISWIATGDRRVDLKQAVEILATEFGVERMAVVGGGHINAACLDAGLIDEVSMMYAPGIDGRGGMTAAFDGRAMDTQPVKLQLTDVKQYPAGTVWMRYKML